MLGDIVKVGLYGVKLGLLGTVLKWAYMGDIVKVGLCEVQC